MVVHVCPNPGGGDPAKNKKRPCCEAVVEAETATLPLLLSTGEAKLWKVEVTPSFAASPTPARVVGEPAKKRNVPPLVRFDVVSAKTAVPPPLMPRSKPGSNVPPPGACWPDIAAG